MPKNNEQNIDRDLFSYEQQDLERISMYSRQEEFDSSELGGAPSEAFINNTPTYTTYSDYLTEFLININNRSQSDTACLYPSVSLREYLAHHTNIRFTREYKILFHPTMVNFMSSIISNSNTLRMGNLNNDLVILNNNIQRSLELTQDLFTPL